MSGQPDFTELPRELELTYRSLMLEKDLEIERQRSKTWQELAGRYDDIRDWLRICSDNPEGWEQFYRECCMVIFGFYRDEADDNA